MDKNLPIDSEKINILLGETGRILADVHHEISLSRRACIIQNLSMTEKNAIESNKIGSFLFGQEFTDSLQDSVAMVKSSKDLMKPSQHLSKKFPPRQNQQDGKRNEFLNSKVPGKRQNFRKITFPRGSKPYHPNRRSPVRRRSPHPSSLRRYSPRRNSQHYRRHLY